MKMNNKNFVVDSSNVNRFYDANEGFIKGNMQKEIYDQYKNYVPVEPKVKSEKEVTKETVDYVITKYVSVKEEEKTVTPKMIIEAVAKLFRVNEDDIISKRKTKEIVVPRQVSIYLCKNLTELSFNKIGDYFGGKDHSTVMHAVKKVEYYIENDPEIKEKVSTLTKDLKN